ncbi:MAG: hypothetical protein WC372_08425 [Candidatus Neomarinimicrobiota bacterium]|jgi:opacity protein-like surface antigen|nr:hypothetical protein [bacterium]
MKKLIMIASVLPFVSAMLFAGGTDSTKTAIAEDAKCLQFRIGSNFSLSSFQGSSISYKKHTSENRAYRAGITVSGEMSKDSRTLENYNDADSLHRDYNINNHVFSITVNWQRLEYSRSGNMYFYYGYGPNIAYVIDCQEYLSEEFRTTEPEITEDQDNNILHGISAGATLLAGVEYFITASVSIHAEYSQGISYTYQWYKIFRSYNEENIMNESRQSSTVSLNSGGARLGCSFYF